MPRASPAALRRTPWLRSLPALALGFTPLVTSACGDPCPEALLPGICAGSRHTVPSGWTIRDAVLVDLDGDGSSELVSISSRQIHVAWRDGRRRSQALPERTSALVSGDFDGDGRPDMALGLWDEEAGVRLGFFSVDLTAEADLELVEFDSVGPLETPALALWAGDLDGDGRDEIVLMDREGEAMLTVDGLSRELRRTPLGAVPVGFDLGDLDGDGALDLAVADFLGAQILLLRGDGEGIFAAPVGYPSALGLDSVVIGDLDDDGANDLVGRGGTAELWVHPGDGAGGLGEPFQIELAAAGGSGSGLAVVPAGSDGVGGVMLAEEGALSTYLLDTENSLLGRARGRASGSRSGGALRRAGPGAWLFLGESIQELELGEEPRPVEEWRRRTENSRLDRWSHYALGDLDLDGIPDIVALRETREHEDEEWAYQAEVFLGDGDGQFSEGSSLDAAQCQSLVVGDFDGDGAGDVLGLDALTAPWVSFGERSPGGTIALPVAERNIWTAASAFESPARTRVVVELRRYVEDNYSNRIELMSLDGSGALTDTVVLTEGRELLGHWVRDLDGDGDDDLMAIAREPSGRVLLSWIAEDEALLPGSVQRIDELVGWPDDLPLAGVGVGVFEPSGDSATPEVVIAGEGGLARLLGVEGPAPTVNLETGHFETERDPIPSIFPDSERVANLTVGDLDGDDVVDVLRCGTLCSVILGGDGGLASDAEAVSVPSAIAPLDLDDDGQLDFLVGDEAGFGAMLTATHAGPALVAEWGNFALEKALVGDLDADGASEILFSTELGIITFWRTGGDDERTVGLEIDWGAGPRVEALADLDDDGRDELLLAPVDLPDGENALVLARWDGGDLRLEVLEAPGFRPRYDLRVRDLDGDGLDDLVAADRDGVVIAYGVEAGRFGSAERVDTPSAAAADGMLGGEIELDTADLDGDGRPELLRFESGQLTVLWGRAERTWGVSTVEADGFVIRGQDLLIRRADTLYLQSVDGQALGQARRVTDDPELTEADRMLSGADLDGDGLDDLLTIHGGDLWIWLSRGAGLRAPYVMRGMIPYGVIPTLADLDGGGLAEIIVGTEFGLSVLWGEGDH